MVLTSRLCRSLSACAATLFVSLCAVPAALADPAQPNANQAPCGTSFNPYDYSPAALSACGITTTPLSGISAMPDGGLSYNYNQAGGTTTHEYVLPSGFDGLTASPAELRAYGLPEEPTNSLPAAGAWSAMMAHFHLAPPPPFLAQLPQSEAPNATDFEHAGYYATGGPGTFTYETTSYYEGNYNNTVCTSNGGGEAYIWGGIQSTSGALGQDGTAHNVPGLSNHEAWYSTMSGNSYTTVGMAFSASANDQMLTSAQWTGSSWSFLVWDYSKNNGASTSGVGGDYRGERAEAIVENPDIDAGTLADFGSLQFTSVYTNVAPFPGNGLAGENPTGFSMMGQKGQTLAQTGGISAPGSFVVNWVACGP